MTHASSRNLTQLRQFGITLGIILLAITGYQFWMHERLFPWLAGIGIVFIVAGFFFPRALGPIYRPWMWGAEKIGFVMNRVILTIFFILILSPIAWVLRLFHPDPLHLRWHPELDSYFESKSVQPPEQFKNIF